MKYLNRSLAIVLVATLAFAPTAAADETGVEAKLIESKAGAIVSVKFVLQISFNIQGQQGEQEQNSSVTGVMVDPAGLVMVPSAVFDLGRGGRRRPRGMSLSSKPTNIRVVFPGEDKEHPAILGAKDSKFGLAFVLIKDLADKKVSTVDMTKVAEPKIGDTLYGVSRLDQGFDHAPVCDSVKVTGVVEKPRPMWSISGGSTFVAEPLYTADGAVAGVCAIQSGVGDDSSSMPFLLPLKIVQPVVDRAKKESERALEEILEAEEEEAVDGDGEDEDKGGDDDGGDDDGGDDDGGDGEDK